MAIVSVIVPCYNYARYLGACLESILQQRGFLDFEVILIDDASPDAPEEAVKRFQDPRICFIRHPRNMGHLATVREGFRRATGRYLARLDADDFWHPDFLKTTVSALEGNPEVGLVHTHYALVDAQGRILPERARPIPFRHGYKGSPLPALLLESYLPPVACLFRRECLGSPEAFFEEAVPYSEDWQLCLRVALRHPFYFVDEVLAFYRVHEANLHVSLARSGKAESSEIRILDLLFSDAGFPEEFRIYRRRAYAACYRRLADQYFGFHKPEEARRCYLQALRYRPHLLFTSPLLRRLLATLLPGAAYERVKGLVR